MKRIKYLVVRPWVPAALGKGPYLWIFSLVFFVGRYFYSRPSALELAACIATILVFLPLYFASFWKRDWQLLPLVAATMALGGAWIFHTPGAYTFFIFAACMCAGITSRAVAYAAVVVILSLAVLAALVAGLPFSFTCPCWSSAFPSAWPA